MFDRGPTIALSLAAKVFLGVSLENCEGYPFD
jgi:hypothetical protein